MKDDSKKGNISEIPLMTHGGYEKLRAYKVAAAATSKKTEIHLAFPHKTLFMCL